MDRYEKAALNFARKHGYEHEDALPVGFRDGYRSCPLARALGGGVTGSCWFPVGLHEEEEETVPLPPSVKEFVKRFDDGEYPHLIDSMI